MADGFFSRFFGGIGGQLGREVTYTASGMIREGVRGGVGVLTGRGSNRDQNRNQERNPSGRGNQREERAQRQSPADFYKEVYDFLDANDYNPGIYEPGVFSKNMRDAWKRFEDKNEKTIKGNYDDQFDEEKFKVDGTPDDASVRYMRALIRNGQTPGASQSRPSRNNQRPKENAQGTHADTQSARQGALNEVIADVGMTLDADTVALMNEKVLKYIAAFDDEPGAADAYDAKTKEAVRKYQERFNSRMPENARIRQDGVLDGHTLLNMNQDYEILEEDRKRRPGTGAASAVTLEQAFALIVNNIKNSNLPPEAQQQMLAFFNEVARTLMAAQAQQAGIPATGQPSAPSAPPPGAAVGAANTPGQLNVPGANTGAGQTPPPGTVTPNVPAQSTVQLRAQLEQLQRENRETELRIQRLQGELERTEKRIAELQGQGPGNQSGRPAAQVSVSAPGASADFKTFNRNDSAEVQELVSAFNTVKRGKNGGTLTSHTWDAKVEAFVKQYQTDNGLTASGNITQETLETLALQLAAKKALNSRANGGFDEDGISGLSDKELAKYTAAIMSDPTLIGKLSGLNLIVSEGAAPNGVPNNNPQGHQVR